ncbi:permease prefix domain 1-containing protein [Clostridium oryzae]|uniref:Uncharacterized protein n=1 Tax=Clostridium oryzae TaxID=1450648 RepID=A0A1V4IXU4_9CLOT|nr:permease prefix domain 1-containing protein [Clostridium oryzae]OPJ64650.1 hypothetical protein CLORY_05190 [Clostridium oryzae]
MGELKSYVNNLFKKYANNKQIEDLKAEILSNLEAKKADLISSGMTEEKAIEAAKRNITTIDNLIDGNKQIFINQFSTAGLQDALLYTVIAWITTIPMFLFREFFVANWILFIAILILGYNYYTRASNKNERFIAERRYVNIKNYYRLRRLVWAIWGVFVAVYILFITGVYFASNIWFSRPVAIDGPYSLAVILLRYYVPFISIIIPLAVNRLPKLILKCEVGERYE